MPREAIDRKTDASEIPWKRIGQKRIEKSQQTSQATRQTIDKKIGTSFLSVAYRVRNIIANIFLSLVHISSRISNRPLVDLGQQYSVVALNERINSLEEILVKQWTNLKEDDFLTPNEEIKQYIAACHVVRQYDRITDEQLAARLGTSHSKAAMLIDQLIDDEIITEGYTVTFHDIRRSAIDAAIEQKIGHIKNVTVSDAESVTTLKDKKH